MTIKTDLTSFRYSLLQWYRKTKRDLPWRCTSDPYRIWVSEIMLQQTRVKKVLEYYSRFIGALPDITSLAEVDRDALMKLWEGLGYYRRVLNMQKAARILLEQGKTNLPSDYEELISLPGIGRYTASAIASIAFGKPSAVLDGNVKRVLSRIYSIDDPVDDSRTETRLWSHAEELLDPRHPGDHNQAMMELGAKVCIPGQPRCTICPVTSECRAFADNTQLRFPVKKPKNIPSVREVMVFLLKKDDQYLIVQRPAEGLLPGLWEFPSLPRDKALVWIEQSIEEKLIDHKHKDKLLTVFHVRHQYSHFTLKAEVLLLSWKPRLDDGLKENGQAFQWVTERRLKEFAFHRAHSKIIESLDRGQFELPLSLEEIDTEKNRHEF